MKLHRRLLTVSALALATIGLVVGNVAAAPLGPVGTTPATGTPQLDSSNQSQYIRQLVPCGNLMYAVGTISTINQKGTVSSRTGAFSFSATAPFTLTSWAPSINGKVNTIGFVNGDCSSAYIGGTFTTVNGTAVKNLAKISTTTGNVDPTFKHSASGQVGNILGWNGHLFVGGWFKKVNSNTNAYFASLNTTTGNDDGYISQIGRASCRERV